jgi:hypothetical protein
MTTLTTLSWADQVGGSRACNLQSSEARKYAAHDFRDVQPLLADDFETWYAQKKSKSAHTARGSARDVWPPAEEPDDLDQSSVGEILGTIEPSTESSDDERPDHAQCVEESPDVAMYPPDCWVDWSQYRFEDKDLRQKKIKSRKWKLSTPPALSKMHEKHLQRLESRRPARKTLRHSWNITWDAEGSAWPTMPLEEIGSSSVDGSGQSLETNKFETLYSEISWSERQLWELFPDIKKYKKTYQPSLLRWCCSSNEE